MSRSIPALALLLAAAGSGPQAHHSIASVYDSSKRVTVEGVVTRFEFVNPHPLLTVDVTDGGRAQPWRFEMDNRSELAAIGVTAATINPGDRVIITGSPARTELHRLYIARLERPADGFAYEQVGSRPRIRPPSR